MTQARHPVDETVMAIALRALAAVLFKRVITLDPGAPDRPNRDRFVLPAGHGSMLLYGRHHLMGHAAGIEMTSGPPGQWIATAVMSGSPPRRWPIRSDP